MSGPDCYKCKHRGEVPGSAHSRCRHPAFSGDDDPLIEMMAIFSSVGRVPPMQAQREGIEVVGSEQGIRGGWFNHPWNFDPIWLLKCTGFTRHGEMDAAT